ncbi:unnamed protein product [Urochloa decumbens]|uniref:Uncharacterized protein n=1 Tax=Urochloa decumbens TaxID=240449 RepID=A0ABC9DLP8_9POAL
MQLFHFIAAWLFPGAACSSPKAATTKAMTAESSSVPDDNASSMAFSVKAADDDSGSCVSSSSSSPSSSSDDHPKFFTSRHHQQQQQSPPASPLCFGAGGAAGRFLRGSRAARARSPTKHEAAAAKASMSPAPAAKGDAVGRYLRKISRRLRKARAAAVSNKGSPPSRGGGAGDDTARERAEAVARAISYCKETLRLGAEATPPSPSLGDLLHGRQPEIIASAAACCGDGSAGSKTPPPMQATGKQAGKDKEATRPVSPSRDSSVTGSDIIVHGKELPRHGHDAMDKCCGEPATMAEPATSSSPSDLAADEMGMPDGSFDEMEFLKNFDGDEEMIGHHFITLHI